MTQLALCVVALAIGWSLTLCVSTYCLFASALLSYAQPQLSATFSAAAALVIATQLVVFPRLVRRLGEHLSCAHPSLHPALSITSSRLLPSPTISHEPCTEWRDLAVGKLLGIPTSTHTFVALPQVCARPLAPFEQP